MARLRALGPVLAVALSACAEGESFSTWADKVAAVRTSPEDPAPLQVQVVDRRPAQPATTGPAVAAEPTEVAPHPVPPAVREAVRVAATGTAAVQLCAFRDEAAARVAWSRLSADDALAGLQPRFETVRRAGGTLVRLKAGPLPTPEAARAVCVRLGVEDPWCAKGSFAGPA